MFLFLYSLLITFNEFVENIECGRQRIMFATTVIFITKSMSLDLFFLRFQYSFFRCFHIHEQQFDWRKMVVLSMERKREKETERGRDREYDWYQNRKGLCKVDATLAWFSKTTLNLFSMCYRVMKPLTSVYLHFLSLRKKFFK